MEHDFFAGVHLIKASAGSGKTYTLMDKMGEMVSLEVDPVEPENVLATTFTVKAADELLTRIRGKLLEKGKFDEAQTVMDALIGTVNGICSRLLSEYAIEAGLAPQLDVLPEENAKLFFNAAAAEVFTKRLPELQGLVFRMDMNPLQERDKDRDWRETVRRIVNLARSNDLDSAKLAASAELSTAKAEQLFDGTVSLSLDAVKQRITPEQLAFARIILDNPGSYVQASGKFAEALLKFVQTPNWHNASALRSGPGANDRAAFGNIHELIAKNLVHSRELQADVTDMIRKLFTLADECMASYARYKKNYGLIDFADQETQLLHLLDDAEFRNRIGERVRQIMVDEFQDTSPVQLALFLKLHQAVGHSIWVGDPKQAIYGFRGTDPRLMQEVAKRVHDAETLEFSWRSQKHLIDLSNAMFTAAFATVPAKDITLSLPEKHQNDAWTGGVIESWILDGTAEEQLARIAQGIVELKARKLNGRELRYGDIAVLLRSNANCEKLAKELARWNVPAAAPAGLLKETAECQLVMAAYRYAVDRRDTAALATLAALKLAPQTWVRELAADKAKALAAWDSALGPDFPAAGEETPLELLDKVIAVLQLDRVINAMTDSDRRRRNVDALRKFCRAFLEQGKLARTPATHTGFIAAFMAGETESASGISGDCVQVMTYHKSKGLEWPVVILGNLDSGLKKTPFDLAADSLTDFDPEAPLAGRFLSCIPNPFGESVAMFKETDKEAVKAGHTYVESYEKLLKPVQKEDRAECKRLMYVGVTRAEHMVVFAVGHTTKDKGATDVAHVKWLNLLTDAPLFQDWKFASDRSVWNVNGTSLEIETRLFDRKPEPKPEAEAPVWKDELPETKAAFEPARGTPSGAELPESEAAKLEFKELPYNGEPLKTGKTDQWDRLGTALHEYLALTVRRENDPGLAENLIRQYRMEGALSVENLTTAHDNLQAFLQKEYPGAEIESEVPMTCHQGKTLYQGFIDLLIKYQGKYIIIDHKTHPGTKDLDPFLRKCAAQLKLYKKAVEEATRKSVSQTIIHLPNLGKCVEVR